MGLPGPPGPPPATGTLEFARPAGFPKGDRGEQVCVHNGGGWLGVRDDS